MRANDNNASCGASTARARTLFISSYYHSQQRGDARLALRHVERTERQQSVCKRAKIVQAAKYMHVNIFFKEKKKTCSFHIWC